MDRMASVVTHHTCRSLSGAALQTGSHVRGQKSALHPIWAALAGIWGVQLEEGRGVCLMLLPLNC